MSEDPSFLTGPHMMRSNEFFGKFGKMPVTGSAFGRLTARGFYRKCMFHRGHVSPSIGARPEPREAARFGVRMASCRALLSLATALNTCREVTLSELDPITFLIATELLAGPDRNAKFQGPALVHPRTAASSSLILLAEGNSDPAGEEFFEHLRLRASRDFGGSSVEIAYLHHNPPSLPEVVEELLCRRIHQVRILPLLFSVSEQVAEEIAERIADLRQEYAALDIEVLPAIGQDPRLQRLLWQMVRENVLPQELARTS